MAKKTRMTKELVLGGTIAGLLMGGTALASMSQTAAGSGKYFQVKELRGGYQLAADDAKPASDSKPAGDAAADKHCGADAKHQAGQKACGEDKKCSGDKKCGGDKSCG